MTKLSDDRIQALERELSMLEPVFERAVARLNGADAEWNAKREEHIAHMCKMIQMFNIEDKATKAVAIISQLLPRVQELTASTRIVEDYERKRQLLSALLSDTKRKTTVPVGG